ncbi:MAG: hypothetical protein ACI9LY_002931 [Arenicella sp.]|jgi:hypothetical protein
MEKHPKDVSYAEVSDQDYFNCVRLNLRYRNTSVVLKKKNIRDDRLNEPFNKKISRLRFQYDVF